MMQQPHVVKEIKSRYKHVDLVFGTHNLYKFPELLTNTMDSDKLLVDVWDVDGEVALAYSDNPDIGYPSSAEMPDGSIITVYYQHDPDPKLSNSTCLMATKWRPKKKL